MTKNIQADLVRDDIPDYILKNRLKDQDRIKMIRDYNSFFKHGGYPESTHSPCRLRGMIKRLRQEKYKI